MNRRINRRRFLNGLGLGAGASLLLPISNRLIGRALGEEDPVDAKVLIVNVYMLEPPNYIPAPFLDDRYALAPQKIDQWPAMYEPLGAYLDRTVVVDGLKNFIGGHQHRAGTCALSCLPPARDTPEALGPAGGITIDQFLAGTLSQSDPYKSILWGLSGNSLGSDETTAQGVFAAGRESNLPHFVKSHAMMDYLFPDGGPEGEPVEVASFRPLRDRLVADIGRLHQRLAPEERIALEDYEQIIVEFDKRQEGLASIRCDGPEAPGTEGDGQDELASMMSQSALALRCGLTHVVGVTIGTSMNHNRHIPAYREVLELSSDPNIAEPGRDAYYGHGFDQSEYFHEAKRNFHRVNLREIATLLELLDQTPDLDGSSMLDNTAVLYNTGNAQAQVGHHADSNHAMWPGILVAGANTGFETGGRYLRFTHHRNAGDEHRNLSDLYRSLAMGLGVDPSGFNDGAQKAEGSIPEILR